MLSPEAFEQWCWRLGLSAEAKAVITQIRTSPPARHVQSGAGNVSGTYPSIKMGCAIQFESHRDELPFVYLMDHDPQVLEFYDQPYGQLKLKYRNQDDTRNVTATHTPDFFVLREDGAGWVECKMEEDLKRQAVKMPFRYQRRPDGSWFCPPGEAAASKYGLTYRLFSSSEIDWTYIENLRFLGDYLRGSPPPVSPDVALAIRTMVMSQPGIRLLNLITALHRGKADDIYQLILTHQLYVDLLAVRLTDYEHVQVFLDRDQAESYAALQPTATSLPRPSTLQLSIGAPIVLDGKAWTIRAAAQVEEWYWELELTTPRHGSRPLDVTHLDHTELDIELVSARTGRPLGRPWVTFLTDAFSRRLLAVYLTFDPPSYCSCMMTLRECVSRYGRLPQTLVVDGGPDFRSTYFETLVTYYGCEKKTRPGAKPRYGSVIERLFGTANTQFVHNLTGNTQIMKQVRQVTKSIAPREQAVWTLGDLYAYLCIWAYEVYDQQIHPALGMSPRDAYALGIARGGARDHLRGLYDDFRYVSLASTRKQTAQVKPGRGVKINYVYYQAKALNVREVQNKQVPVRYDPFDLGTAYVYVQERWVQARSEHYLQLRGHTERELQLASAELRKQYQNHRRDAAITAKRLADFFADLSGHDAVLRQHWQDAEARDVFAQMEDYQVLASPSEEQEERVPVLTLVQPESSSEQTEPLVQKTKSSRNLQPAAIIEDDEDLEDLDEYGEFH